LIFHILLLPLNFVKLPSWDEVWAWRVLLAASICNAFALRLRQKQLALEGMGHMGP
jgi:hypothetical protein